MISLAASLVVPNVAAAAPPARDPSQPDAWILFDAGTGNVLEAHNERTPLPPASVTKLLTALTVVDKVPQDRKVVISRRAADMPPSKLGMNPGEAWDRDVLLNAMLLASANDAAVALAEASAGSLEGFAKQRQDAASNLGLRDSPTLNDPSGLDDTASYGGGDLVSARDMAIIARAASTDPVISRIVSQRRFDFRDPVDGRARWVINHNRGLQNFEGANGLKTGYTSNARHTYAGSATRNGRTLVAVVLGAPSPYPKAFELMDKGFASPVVSTGTNDVIPAASVSRPVEQAVPVESSAIDSKYVGLGGAALLGGFVLARRRKRRNPTRRLAPGMTG